MRHTDVTDARPLMATVNDEIDRLHRSLGLSDSELLCECGRISCGERITLSREEFAALRAESRRLIAASHVEHVAGVPPH